MRAQTKSLAELTGEAIRVLSRELGPADTMRILNQFDLGQGNYTEDRREIFGEVSLDEILDEIRSTKKGSALGRRSRS